MSSSDKNHAVFEFDLDSILSEFGALDEEPASEKPSFKFDIQGDSSLAKEVKENDVLSAVISDGFKPAPNGSGDAENEYDFSKDEIIAEFESEDDISEETSEINPDKIRIEFDDGEGTPLPSIAEKRENKSEVTAKPEIKADESENISAAEILDEVDRIIAEFKQQEAAETLPSNPNQEAAPVDDEPAQVIVSEDEKNVSSDDEEPEPTKRREAPISAGDEPIPVSEQTKVRFRTVSHDEIEPDLYEGSGIDEHNESELAADADYTVIEEAEPKKEKPRKERKSFREAVAVPVISALAFVAMKIKQSQIFSGESGYESDELGEEMPAEQAAKFYDRHIAGLRLRTRISFVLCALMIYISYGLPVPGALYDVGVKSAVCLIMMIAVMLCGLDIITTGIMSIVRLKPHASALIVLSCLFCMIDAFLSAANVSDKLMPFCAIPSLTIAFTLLGCVMNARSNRIVFNTAVSLKHPYVLTAESDISGGDITLIKGRRSIDGIVRRTEEDSIDESVFGVLAPYFVIIALLLSIIAAAIGKSFSSYAHVLSGIFVCAAPIAMLISFPMPFFVSIKSLIKSSSTIAGWSGLYDIGKAKHIVVTDTDLFPKGCVKISRTRVFAGMPPEKIISFAGSIVSASGSSMVQPFNELLRKAGGTLMPVEAFDVHESGGLTAMVDGEDVCCGNAAFMRLMGVVLPDKYVLNNGVYIAVAGIICGVFEMEYTASDNVKDALNSLLSSGRHAVFAVRDFNITPQMLSVKFDMPTDGFDFPPYSERYEISGAEPSENSKPAALISREGLGALVKLARHGEMLFKRIKLNVALCVASAIIGMLVMFIISLSSLPSVAVALTYLLVWLLITIIMSFTISTP